MKGTFKSKVRKYVWKHFFCISYPDRLITVNSLIGMCASVRLRNSLKIKPSKKGVSGRHREDGSNTIKLLFTKQSIKSYKMSIVIDLSLQRALKSRRG